MTFLYRVIVGRENPDKAYDAVASAWSPHGPWKTLMTTELRKAGIDFEPYFGAAAASASMRAAEIRRSV